MLLGTGAHHGVGHIGQGLLQRRGKGFFGPSRQAHDFVTAHLARPTQGFLRGLQGDQQVTGVEVCIDGERATGVEAHGLKRTFAVPCKPLPPHGCTHRKQGGIHAVAHESQLASNAQAQASAGHGAIVDHVGAFKHRVFDARHLRIRRIDAHHGGDPHCLAGANDAFFFQDGRPLSHAIGLRKDSPQILRKGRPRFRHDGAWGVQGAEEGGDQVFDAIECRKDGHHGRGHGGDDQDGNS